MKKRFELSRRTKETIKQAEIAIGVVAIFILALVFFGSSGSRITGFVPAELALENLNIVLDKSTAFELSSATGLPVYLRNFRISGDIIGSGSVAIYIKDSGRDYLVFTNIGHRDTKMNLITGITGAAIGPSPMEPEEGKGLTLKEKETLADLKPTKEPVKTGLFESECVESCYLPLAEFNQTSFTLSVYLESGTTLKLTKIYYTID